ncbi:MAG: phosphatase PAP2 family protein [Oscillospiraceae bacterium]|nr:phosphatase PAP2 family protein [Oscillospiraceae bacterium]
MEFLKLLEQMRTPFLNVFFQFCSWLDSEAIFLFIGIVVFWCVNKRDGYFLLTVGFLGTIISQFIKIATRIPRPWVRDPNFTIVESARAGATGYSFPSGHTQACFAVYGGLAVIVKQRAARALLIVCTLLIGFSRMYLGVHTPADVAVGALISIALIVILRPISLYSEKNPRMLPIVLAIISGVSLLFVQYVTNWRFPADLDSANYAEALKNAWTLFGCSLGILCAWFLDSRYVHFETKGALPVQLLKVLPGIVLLLVLKEGLKVPLTALFGAAAFANSIRYFIVVFLAVGIWPMTFPFWTRVGAKR